MNLPAIVLGDFNADVHKLAATSTFAQMGFLRLQQLYTQMYGEATPPTCKEATNPDTAFLAPELASRSVSISVVQEPLFNAHKVVLISLHSPGKGVEQAGLAQTEGFYIVCHSITRGLTGFT